MALELNIPENWSGPCPSRAAVRVILRLAHTGQGRIVYTKNSVRVEVIVFAKQRRVAFGICKATTRSLCEPNTDSTFCLRDCFRPRFVLQAEILALRPLLLLQFSSPGHKLRLTWSDRVLWVWSPRPVARRLRRDGAPPYIAASDLAPGTRESCPATGLHRLLHHTHDPLPGSLRVPGVGRTSMLLPTRLQSGPANNCGRQHGRRRDADKRTSEEQQATNVANSSRERRITSDGESQRGEKSLHFVTGGFTILKMTSPLVRAFAADNHSSRLAIPIIDANSSSGAYRPYKGQRPR